MTRQLIACLLCMCFCVAGLAQDEKASPVKVDIKGLEGELLDNVQATLGILRQPPENLPLDNWVRRHHARAPKQIREALQPFGYYQPEIRADLASVEDKWHASYRISPGQAVRLRNVSVNVSGPGQDNPRLLAALSKIVLVPNDPLRHERYEEAKTLLREAALRTGYLDAKFTTSTLEVNVARHYADINLRFETGERYRLGAVHIEQAILKPEFVQRYVPFSPGTPYDRAHLIELENGLIDSNYFSEVIVELQINQAVDYVVPIRVTTTPRKPQFYSFGLGYGTDTGPRVSTGFEWRRVNSSGHRASSDMKLSSVRKGLNAQYQIPIADVRKDTLALGASFLEEDAGDGISEDSELGITHTTGWFGWRRSLYLTLGQNVSRIGAEETRFDLLIPGVTLTRTRSDHPLYPRNSIGLSLDVHGAHLDWGSDATFLQGRIFTRYIRPLGEKSRLIIRGEVGATGLDEVTELPLSQRFFAGGDQSVRGYKYQSLGDVNANGAVVGGNYLLVGSVEVDRLIWGDWGLAAFVDTGNASSHSDMDLLTGAGVGIRWRSPVGLVRLDLASPLDDPPDGDDSSIRLHFGIGVEL